VSSGPLPLDPVQLRARLDREAVGRFQLAAIGLAIWSAVALLVDRSVAPDVYGLVAPVHVAIVVGTLAAFVALRRGALPAHHVSLVAFAIWALQVGLMWIAFASSLAEVYLLCILLVLIAAATLHLYGRWVVASIVWTFAGWLIVLNHAPASGTHTLAFFGATLIAIVIHLAMRGYLIGLERAHQQEQRTAAELARALAEAKQALADRVTAEAERESLREQLVHSQRLEALGTLAGGIAHDMNNVLASIVGVAEFARDGADASLRTDLDDILRAAQRGASLTSDLLAFGRRGRYRRETLDPSDVLRSTLALLARTLPRGVEIDARLEHGAAAIDADAAQVGQALINLAINASDAMGGKGRLAISTDAVELDGARAAALELPPGSYLALAVADTGCGMDAETQRRAFEPFFTTKPQGKGTGLGLAMVYGTARSHGGTVTLISTPGIGTTFTILLPRHAGVAPTPASPPAREPSMPRGEGAILVVDDDDDVRGVIARRLGQAGFDVLEARDGREGAATFAARRAEIRLVVLDMSMPVMGGAECFQAIRAAADDARVLLTSGFTTEDHAQACLADGALGLLGKPFSTAQLWAAVEQALRGERVDTVRLQGLA
jgi:signal transduction histidine kinase/CheY-like chemotaxis protein